MNSNTIEKYGLLGRWPCNFEQLGRLLVNDERQGTFRAYTDFEHCGEFVWCERANKPLICVRNRLANFVAPRGRFSGFVVAILDIDGHTLFYAARNAVSPASTQLCSSQVATDRIIRSAWLVFERGVIEGLSTIESERKQDARTMPKAIRFRAACILFPMTLSPTPPS
jgi:hypothetical protein